MLWLFGFASRPFSLFRAEAIVKENIRSILSVWLTQFHASVNAIFGIQTAIEQYLFNEQFAICTTIRLEIFRFVSHFYYVIVYENCIRFYGRKIIFFSEYHSFIC